MSDFTRCPRPLRCTVWYANPKRLGSHHPECPEASDRVAPDPRVAPPPGRAPDGRDLTEADLRRIYESMTGERRDLLQRVTMTSTRRRTPEDWLKEYVQWPAPERPPERVTPEGDVELRLMQTAPMQYALTWIHYAHLRETYGPADADKRVYDALDATMAPTPVQWVPEVDRAWPYVRFTATPPAPLARIRRVGFVAPPTAEPPRRSRFLAIGEEE